MDRSRIGRGFARSRASARTLARKREEAHAPERSLPALLRGMRRRQRLPDPEPALRRVLHAERHAPARGRRHRRARARSRGHRGIRPHPAHVGAERVPPALAQRAHGVGRLFMVHRAQAHQRTAAPRQSQAARRDRAAQPRAHPAGRRADASAGRGCGLHRFLFLARARHQRRHDVSRQGQRAERELAVGAHRLQRPRQHGRGQRHAGEAAEGPDQGARFRQARLHALAPPRHRARNGRDRRQQHADRLARSPSSRRNIRSSASRCSTTGARATSSNGNTCRSGPSRARRSPPASARGS